MRGPFFLAIACYWLPKEKEKKNFNSRLFCADISQRKCSKHRCVMKDLFKAGDYIFPLTKTSHLNFDTNFHSSTTNDAEISHSDTTKSSVWNSPSFHFHTKYEKWAYSVSIASFDYDCKCVSSHRPCLSEEVLKWLTLLMVSPTFVLWWFLTKSNGFLHSPHLHKSSFNPPLFVLSFFFFPLIYIKWLWQGGFWKRHVVSWKQD